MWRIVSNEYIDKYAKKSHPKICVPLSFHYYKNVSIIEALPPNIKQSHKFCPRMYKGLSQNTNYKLTRLLKEHGSLNAYLQRFKLSLGK